MEVLEPADYPVAHAGFLERGFDPNFWELTWIADGDPLQHNGLLCLIVRCLEARSKAACSNYVIFAEPVPL